MSKLTEMKCAIAEAESTIRIANSLTKEMASLIVGRLRNINTGYWDIQVLVDLKKELTDFNAITRTWKK